MKILTSNSHPTMTNWLNKIEGIEWILIPRKEFVFGAKQIDPSTYDILFLQEPEHYTELLEIKKPKVVFNHNLPYPLYHAVVYQQIEADKDVKHVVFATSEQAIRWGSQRNTIIPHALDIDSLPKWNPTNDHILSICNDLPNRDWACGYNVWKTTTAGLKNRKLIGWGNEKCDPEAVLGEKTYEETLTALSNCAVFFNHTLHSTFPMTIAEAMGIGCPIVTTNTYFSAKMLLNGGGIVSSVIPELRKNLIAISKDPSSWAKVSERNREKIKEYMLPQKFISSWKKVFETC